MRKVLDDNSGEGPARQFGQLWNRMQDAGRDLLKASQRHQIVTLSAAQDARWRSAAEPVIGEWAKATPNGERVLSTYRSLLADVAAGK